MQITLTRPELEKFVAEQVDAGLFPSAEAVIEAGLERLMESAPLDDETLAAIEEGEAQIDRGEEIDWEQFAAEMRNKYCK